MIILVEDVLSEFECNLFELEIKIYIYIYVLDMFGKSIP